MLAHRLTFAGRVQGVGFRATTLRCSRGLSVFGYVRNLDDGRVELHIEGSLTDLTELRRRVEDVMKAFISETQLEEIDAVGYKTFDIRH